MELHTKKDNYEFNIDLDEDLFNFDSYEKMYGADVTFQNTDTYSFEINLLRPIEDLTLSSNSEVVTFDSKRAKNKFIIHYHPPIEGGAKGPSYRDLYIIPEFSIEFPDHLWFSRNSKVYAWILRRDKDYYLIIQNKSKKFSELKLEKSPRNVLYTNPIPNNIRTPV